MTSPLPKALGRSFGHCRRCGRATRRSDCLLDCDRILSIARYFDGYLLNSESAQQDERAQAVRDRVAPALTRVGDDGRRRAQLELRGLLRSVGDVLVHQYRSARWVTRGGF